VGVIETHLTHRSSLIRGVAAWAYARSLDREAMPRLETMLRDETVPEAIDEITLALEMIRDPQSYQDRIREPVALR
jgi:hypothetical protein